MRTRIAVYMAKGDGTRDRGEDGFGLYFGEDEITLQRGFTFVDGYFLRDVKSMDCYRSANPRGNEAANGAIGGLLVGGVAGAVVGGLLGAGATTSWYLEIVMPNRTLTFRLMSETDKMKFEKWAKKHGWWNG